VTGKIDKTETGTSGTPKRLTFLFIWRKT